MGFKDVLCICCNEINNVAVELSDLTTFHCSSCDAAFHAEDVQDVIDRWKSVLAWLATAPETSEHP